MSIRQEGFILRAHAIPQVEPPWAGIHLMWLGPPPWIYSLRDWIIQRREYVQPRVRLVCEEFRGVRLNALRRDREALLPFGMVTLRSGCFSAPVTGEQSAPPVDCEVVRLDLNDLETWVRVEVEANLSFAFALRDGKVTGVSDEPVAGSPVYDFRAVGMDAIEVYALSLSGVRFCVLNEIDDDGWGQVKQIKTLQLPLRELMPALTNAADEFHEGESRLIGGETLDETEFNRLVDTIRAGVRTAAPPRPIDQTLLLRDDPSASFEELATLDPIRTLLTHPKWRRVLGFGWFDDDPALVVGQTYQYRITGFFPQEDLIDCVYGFHTIPSLTALPAEFFLRDLRLRLPQPTRVELAPNLGVTGNMEVTRRGLMLRPRSQDWWILPTFGDWSLVIDFPIAVPSVVLEMQDGHALEYVWGDGWGPSSAPTPVPAGPRPLLAFAAPAAQLRLRGRGFLHAIRVPVGQAGIVPISTVLPPVQLVDTPRLDPPLFASIRNLQQPQPVPGDDEAPLTPPARHALGFEIQWRPALQAGLRVWPSDAGAAPPIDGALHQIEHRQEPDPAWEPVLPEENWTVGDRDSTARNTLVFPGVDLMTLFPESGKFGAGIGLDLYWRDVFDFREGGFAMVRPVPPPGTEHQYRIRTIDAIGRSSLAWTLTNILRLEKHVPPPVPVGPDETPADQRALPEPTGVQARVLVRDAPDLTAADVAILGADDNVIVLRWGWHQQQRDQDMFAAEFRVYFADPPLDAVSGRLTAFGTASPGNYEATLELDRSVSGDAAKGTYVEAGYPFYVRSHDGGSVITARLEARVPGPDGRLPQPRIGTISLPLHLTPGMMRPPAWNARITTQPITVATEYTAYIRNRLTLTDGHRRHPVWVGVSAADDQAYIPDQLAPAETRAGNESAITAVLCDGRYYGRPLFDVPPAIEPVPVLMTPEAHGRPIYFPLDLTPYLAGTGLNADDRIRPERVSADAVFAAYYVAADHRIIARVLEREDAAEPEVELTIANPADKAAVVAALNGARTTALEDRYVVFLAGSHPYRDRLFEPAVTAPVGFGPFMETLPPDASRWVYRVRKSDLANHLSAGGALVNVIVRVPSRTPGSAPEKSPAVEGDLNGLLRLRLVPGDDLTHVLAFTQIVAPAAGPPEEAELLRVPNAHDLYPAGGIRLRTPDGAIRAPQVKSLGDADVVTDAEGFRLLTMSLAASASGRVRVWACTLTRDGAVSPIGGPWSLIMPVAPLPLPTLSVSGTAPDLTFSWSWPGTPAYATALERSAGGGAWQRVSPVLPETATSYAYTAPAGAWQYRLRVKSPDGRAAASNTVIP